MKLSKTPMVAALLLMSIPATPRAAGNLVIEATTFEPFAGPPVAAELGTLVVPESRQATSQRTIRLKFVRFASTARKRAPPIVYLAGGPGGSGIEAAKGSRFSLFMALREIGDVIALDQRGTGASEPGTDCTEQYMIPFAKPLDRAEAEAIFAEGMKNCFDRLRKDGMDPAAYSTLESAGDIDDLRRALGAEKITLWGISYGTHLALATLRAYGDHVDRAILAGVEPLDHTLKLPGDQEALLDSIASLAQSDPVVGKAVPDLKRTITRVLSRLRENAPTVTLVHPATGEPVPVRVGPLDLQFVLAGMLTGPDAFSGMPDFVSRLDRGDWMALALRAARFRMGNLPSAMSVAMDCASGARGEWLARIASEATETLLGDAINIPFPGICHGLGVPDLGDDYRKAVRSEVPVLLISGTLDGRTPPRNAARVLEGLDNAQHVVIDGAGHSDPLFLSSPKILDDMKAFLRGEEIPAARIAIDRPRFIPPRTVVELSDEVLSSYVGTYEIEGDDVRRVVKAGSILFTIRGSGGAPYPLRPLSATDFFWEGTPGSVHFEVSAEGTVVGMVVDPDGSGAKQVTAAKVD
jgi:pimeloyl-ACP methyl ester carboxylesterase